MPPSLTVPGSLAQDRTHGPASRGCSARGAPDIETEEKMTRTAKVVSVTLLLAIAAFLFGSHGPLGQTLWPAPVSLASPPTAMQVKLFMLLDAVEALAFGLGLAFVFFAWPAVKRIVPSTGCAAIMYVSTAWFLVNWWIHDNFHMVAGLQPGGCSPSSTPSTSR
jgi:hypothetical protein